MSSSRPSLRDHLISSLSNLPNTTPLHLTVLTSRHKRTNAIFPHAANAPKCLEKEYFVTVGTDIPPDRSSDTLKNTLSPSQTPIASSSSTPSNTLATSSIDPITPTRHVLIVAVHAYLYTIPSTSTSILYISKVDTSGYAPQPLPIARELLIAFLGYFLSKRTRPSETVLISLFARSQGQYLFPNSVQSGGKRVAGGLRLCQWWKGVFERLIVHLGMEVPATSSILGRVRTTRTEMRFLLPSYSEAEARGMLGKSQIGLLEGVEWMYAPPFPENLFDPTTDRVQGDDMNDRDGKNDTKTNSLARIIPSLPDDPKSRFLDELVLTQLPHLAENATRKAAPQGAKDTSEKQTIIQEGNDGQSDKGKEYHPKDEFQRMKNREQSKSDRREGDRRRAQGVLARISKAEFWERMGFRQECISGDVTGFFYLASKVDAASNGSDYQDPKSSIQVEGVIHPDQEVNSQKDTLVNHDIDPIASSHIGEASNTSDTTDTVSTALPTSLVDRIHLALLNTDFGNIKEATEGTARWLASTKAIVADEIGVRGWEAVTGIIVAKEGLKQTAQKRAAESVTMLQPRKKVRKEAEAVNVLQPRRK